MKKRDEKKNQIANQEKQGEKTGEDWKEKYLRVLADYQNLEKRTDERITAIRIYAAESFIAQLLPVVDTFDRVRQHIQDPGLDLAHKELMQVLTAQGVTKIEVKGQIFNPMFMDCVEVVQGDENVVLEEVLPGYTMREKVLRVAKVKVGKEMVFK